MHPSYKLLAGVGLLGLLILKPVQAMAEPELAPLDTLEMNSLDDSLYAMKRCAAVSITMSFKLGQDGDPSVPRDLMAKYNRFADIAFNVTNILAEKAHRTVSAKEINNITEDIKAMSEIYDKGMNDHYLSTGKYLTDLVMGDTQYCTLIWTEVINKKRG